MSKSPASKIPGAKQAPIPNWIEPMKAVLIDAPFDRAGWIFEEKYDGIRTIAFMQSGKSTLYSRNRKEMTVRYPELKDLPRWVSAKEAILDGEIIVRGKH